MALSADITLSTGVTITLDENEIRAIDKWLKFEESQKEAVHEVVEFRKSNEDDISQEHFKVSVDPFDEEHWDSMLKGFLAAYGIIGYRNMIISTYVYYNPIKFDFPEQK